MKAKKIILTVLSVLLGLLMINGGLSKFIDYMPKPDKIHPEMLKDMMAMMEISWLMPLVGFGELLGGLLIIFPKTRALGAVVLFPIMVGILLVSLCVDTSGLAINLPFFLIECWIIFENRQKYMPMIS